MSGEHTPGPWTVIVYDSKGDFDIRRPRTTTSETVATVYCGCKGEYDAEAHANARLIAAAPDLLDALKGMFALAATMIFEPDPGQPHPLKDGVFDKVVAKTRAALLKAETP